MPQLCCLRIALIVKVVKNLTKIQVSCSILVMGKFGMQIDQLSQWSNFQTLIRTLICYFKTRLHRVHLVLTGSNLCIGWLTHQKSFCNISFRILMALSSSFRPRCRNLSIQILLFEFQSFFGFFFRNQLLNQGLFCICI